MNTLGFKLSGDALEQAFNAFIDLADKKKHVYDDDLVAIMQQNISQQPPGPMC